MREIEQIDVDVIEQLKGRRTVNDAAVTKLMQSMQEIGLLMPITVRLMDDFECANGEVVDGVPVLVTGAHRLEAAKRLGWNRIDCFYFHGEDDLDAELWEIDENLMRAELTPVQQAEHLKRRKEIWEAKREAENSGGTTCPTRNIGYAKPPENEKGFAAETSEKTGVDKRTINRAISRAEKIPEPIREKIEGTKLDTGSYMDSIKDLPEEEMAEKVERDLAAPQLRREHIEVDEREDRIRKERSRLFHVWISVSEETRNWFLSEVAKKAA